jgi:methyl-accepting chemotaxis protein
MGPLGDDKAVPALEQWIIPGKPADTRQAAISSLARLEKENRQITQQIAGYLNEPRFPIRISTIFALGERGDASAVPALEALLNSNELSIEMAPMIKGQIARLKKGPGKKAASGEMSEPGEGGEAEQDVAKRLDRLEKMIQDMSERLKSIEERLPAKK